MIVCYFYLVDTFCILDMSVHVLVSHKQNKNYVG